MKFQTASLTGEKVDGVASIFINEADGIEFESPPNGHHYKSYVLAAPGDMITTRTETSLEDEVEEFVDLVVDGVLRATSTPKKGRGKKYTNTVSFDRVLYHRFEGGKKRGLKAGVMEVQLQNSLDDKEAADGQKTLDLGTVELQIWRKYPDALLPKDVVAAWNNVAQNSGESRAGSLEDFPRWSDQNLRLTTGVPQDFEIGFSGDYKTSRVAKDKITEPRLDFRLFTSVKFHLATPATLRGLGFEDVPEYQSASKAPAVQSTIGSEETAKQGRKPLPGAPEKAHKGEKPEKGSKVKTSKAQSSSKSEAKPTGDQKPKKTSKKGKTIKSDDKIIESNVINLEEESEAIMEQFQKASNELLQETATEGGNTKEEPTNKFTPINKGSIDVNQQATSSTTVTTLPLPLVNNQPKSPTKLKKMKPLFVRGVKGSPADQPPKSVLETMMDDAGEIPRVREEAELALLDKFVVVTPTIPGQTPTPSNDEGRSHLHLLSPSELSNKATLEIANMRGNGSIPPNDIHPSLFHSTLVRYGGQANTTGSSTQSFNTSQDRRDAGIALQECYSAVFANPQVNDNSSAGVQLRTPVVPREASLLSDAPTEIVDPEDIARVVAQFVPPTPNTISSPSLNFESSQSRVLGSSAKAIVPANTPRSREQMAIGLGINTEMMDSGNELGPPHTPNVIWSTEQTPDTDDESRFLCRGSPALRGSALQENNLRRGYLSESPTPSRERGSARNHQRTSSASQFSRKVCTDAMGSIDGRIQSPLGVDGVRRTLFSTAVKSSTQSPSLPPDLHVSSASAALSIKRPEKRKPSILAEGDEVSRKLSFPPADRDSDDINKRITAARFRLEAAEKKKAKLDEQDRLAHEVQEMEQAAERLERENEIREATWGRSTED